MLLPVEHKKGSNILLAGAGGGYDFLCALPIALELLKQGNKVHLANYSFTALDRVSNSRWLTEEIIEITENSSINNSAYFPELYLTKWFKEKKGISMPLYCFPIIGIKSLTRAYVFLKEILSLNCVYLVDGGVDGIFRGDEFDLGTPSMDSISIISALLSGIENTYYVMTAFGTEGINKEVSHADALDRISDLIKNDKLYGVSSLLKNTETGREFIEAGNYIFKYMPPQYKSTIVSSIIKSMEGHFGDTAVNEKTREMPVWLSPLTLLYWFFDLEGVAQMKLYYSKVLETDSVREVSNIIEETRSGLKQKKREIPI